ncbi:hypothetical protein [Celeribacter naphthalenivorans]|uniref:hypothetical protein n=1 Tax=Celeribacter naphthalenivorans TaxID=1614694 RepID=UPI001CF9E3E5|nr:hypothetical protein [Celeribacter naphthalenivorans]
MLNDEIFIDDFQNDDLVFFHEGAGISINMKKQRMILFQKVGGDWFDHAEPLSALRGVAECDPETAQYGYEGAQHGSARGTGLAVGLAVRNAVEKAKARNATGVELRFKSVERPSFLFNILDEKERERLLEAFRQVLSDGAVATPYRKIPDDIVDIYTPLTDEDLLKAENLDRAEREKRDKISLNGRDYFTILTSSVVVSLIFYLSASRMFLGELMILFLLCAFVVWFVVIVLKYLKYTLGF